jgi:hypothetical protein
VLLGNHQHPAGRPGGQRDGDGGRQAEYGEIQQYQRSRRTGERDQAHQVRPEPVGPPAGEGVADDLPDAECHEYQERTVPVADGRTTSGRYTSAVKIATVPNTVTTSTLVTAGRTSTDNRSRSPADCTRTVGRLGIGSATSKPAAPIPHIAAAAQPLSGEHADRHAEHHRNAHAPGDGGERSSAVGVRRVRPRHHVRIRLEPRRTERTLAATSAYVEPSACPAMPMVNVVKPPASNHFRLNGAGECGDERRGNRIGGGEDRGQLSSRGLGNVEIGRDGG